MRRILGIDPGSRVTGFGIIEQKRNDKQAVCIEFGCLRLPSEDMPSRLGTLFVQMKDIVSEFKPTELAVEKVFVHKNALSALKLGQARGVAIAAGYAEGITVHEYAPKQIKLAVTGKGSADKHQVQHMIKILLKLPSQPQADAADALAVALCHFHTISGSFISTWRSYDKSSAR